MKVHQLSEVFARMHVHGANHNFAAEALVTIKERTDCLFSRLVNMPNNVQTMID